MDEIEIMIYDILKSCQCKGMDAPNINKTIREEYLVEIPTKRIRHKLDTMVDFGYLDKEKCRFKGMQGPARNIYRIREATL